MNAHIVSDIKQRLHWEFCNSDGILSLASQWLLNNTHTKEDSWDQTWPQSEIPISSLQLFLGTGEIPLFWSVLSFAIQAYPSVNPSKAVYTYRLRFMVCFPLQPIYGVSAACASLYAFYWTICTFIFFFFFFCWLN